MVYFVTGNSNPVGGTGWDGLPGGGLFAGAGNEERSVSHVDHIDPGS